jgi:primosomal protein N'
VLGVSGEVPVFDGDLLRSLRWAAHHYVAPLSVVLAKASPPTLPKVRKQGLYPEFMSVLDPAHPLFRFASSVSKGERHTPVVYGVHWSDTSWIEALGPPIQAGRSVVVVAATVKEAFRISEFLKAEYKGRVAVVPDSNDSSVTRVWEAAAQPGSILVGTPRIAAWPLPQFGMAVILEESRRAMKDRQTPTIHVRDLLRMRSRIEGFGLLFVGSSPSVEVIAAGAEVIQPGRPWGLVEVVDRREDPPGSGFISERTVNALKSVVAKGDQGFVFTHMRAADASARCVTCRQLRRCVRCGSHVGQRSACPRCQNPAPACTNCGGVEFESMGSVPARIIAELSKRLGPGTVGPVENETPIKVGTERDLAVVEGVHLAVAADVDSLLYGQNYRASEEGLRILARLVGTVVRGKGYRTMLQTSHPESDLVAALRRGEPIPYLESVLAQRARDGFPPATEMLAIETRNAEAGSVTQTLDGIAPGMVMGPLQTPDGFRWLLQGDLGAVRTELRAVVQRLRDSGATVRIDADPIDL